MTTIYKFKAYYTDSGVGAVQNPAPVISIVNMADDSLVATAQPTTASTNMPGLYSYEYSGADGLDLVAFFATTDTGCDVKQLASYVSEKITTNLNADVAGVEAKVDTIDDLVDDLETRLTAARAGYLDNLSAGAVALEDTLTAIKGAGWTTETLKVIHSYLSDNAVWSETTYENLIDDGRIDQLIDAIKAKTDNLPVDPADDSDLDTAIAAVKTVVDAILVDTGTTLPATLETIDNFLDTEVADILEDTATTIPGLIDALPTAGEIWANDTRTLTYPISSVTNPSADDPIEIYRDTTVVINFAGLGDVTAYAAAGDIAWFTIKENLNDADTSAILQMKTTSFGDSGAVSTLLYVNGAAPTSNDEGSFLFTDYVAGAAVATLKAVAAVDLPVYAVTPVNWDIKVTSAAGVVSILATGTAYIYATSTRTIV